MAAMQRDCQLPWQRMIAAPWRILIVPTEVWVQLQHQPQWFWALFSHWVLALAGWLITREAMLEMTMAAGLPSTSPTHPVASFISMAIILLVSLLSLSLIFAWIGIGAIRVIGYRASFLQVLTWLVYGLLPYSIGQLAGRFVFSLIRPLAENPQQALSFILKPYSLGPVGFMPETLPPLSFGWFACSYYDAFGIWSAALLIFGAVNFLKLSARRTLWLTVELVLISVAILTGLWNATQYLLLQIAG